MSDVIFSRRNKKIFHEMFCPYVKRIEQKYRVQVPEKIARKEGLCECKFCRSVKGMVYKYRDISEYEVTYDTVDDAVCVRTPIGFWKIIWRENIQCWQLFHMNGKGWHHFNPDLPTKTLMRGAFHRQDSFVPSGSLNSAMKYIKSHDDCLQQATERGVKNMPRSTPKQRLHYRQQRNRKRKEDIRNVYKIFKELEKEREK